MSKYGIPSTTPPTEPGWYWSQSKSGIKFPHELIRWSGELWFALDTRIKIKVVERPHTLWWPIPIEVPEVPK